MKRLQSFTADEDIQILQQLNKQVSEKYSSKKIDLLNSAMFEVVKDQFREESTLHSVDQLALDIRKDLLLKFSKVFSKVIKLVNMKERSTPGTFSNKHFVSRHLSLAVAINTVIDRALANIPSGSMAYTRVNRRKAQEFEEAGNIDHEGKHSIFGQIMQCIKGDR